MQVNISASYSPRAPAREYNASGVTKLWAGAGTGTSAGAGAARGSGGGVQPLGKAIKDVLDHLRLQGEAVEVSTHKTRCRSNWGEFQWQQFPPIVMLQSQTVALPPTVRIQTLYQVEGSQDCYL